MYVSQSPMQCHFESKNRCTVRRRNVHHVNNNITGTTTQFLKPKSKKQTWPQIIVTVYAALFIRASSNRSACTVVCVVSCHADELPWQLSGKSLYSLERTECRLSHPGVVKYIRMHSPCVYTLITYFWRDMSQKELDNEAVKSTYVR